MDKKKREQSCCIKKISKGEIFLKKKRKSDPGSRFTPWLAPRGLCQHKTALANCALIRRRIDPKNEET